MGVEFVDEVPPHGNRNGGIPGWRQLAVFELRERPGKWARVQDDTNVASSKEWQKLGCETITRDHHSDDLGRRRCTVYARWPETANTQADDECAVHGIPRPEQVA